MQNAIEHFVPDEKIFFGVANVKYDNVWKVKGTGVVQCYADIHHKDQYLDEFSTELLNYDFNFRDQADDSITEFGKHKNKFILKDASRLEIINEWGKVTKIVK